MRTDGETESSTTRISTRISAGKVDTIDSKQRKCFSATGDARRKEEKPPGAITQTRRQPESYSLATTKKQ